MSAITNTARQDSQHGEPVKSRYLYLSDAGSNRTWRITLDATHDEDAGGPFIIIDEVDASDPVALVTGSSHIELNLADLPAAPNGVHVKLRETKGCDADGNPVYAFVLRSPWVTTPVGTDFT